MRSLLAKFRNWRTSRYLPAAGEELSGFDQLRAVNNAVVISDKLPRRHLRPLTRNGR